MLNTLETQELESLRAKQKSSTYWLSQEQFDRIKYLAAKQYEVQCQKAPKKSH